jgi:hypothetical protein
MAPEQARGKADKRAEHLGLQLRALQYSTGEAFAGDE